MKGVIIAHGSLRDDRVLKEVCSSADIVICADGGAEYAFKSGIVPNYLIGDFDSIGESVFNFFCDKGVMIERYPKEKDYTDTELCVHKAIKEGCSDICILAGTGDRIDHSLGNIGLLHFIKDRGIDGRIVSDSCTIYLCRNEITLSGNIGDTISIIPFKGDVLGITTEGLKYQLHDDNIEFGSPLGISNIMIDRICRIRIKSGEILVIKQNNV